MKVDQADISWISKVFRKIDMFSTLSITDMGNLIENMEKIPFAKGKKIIKQGDKGDSFFIVYKGKVKASVRKGLFSSAVLGELGPEQFFGEMALLTEEPRSATIEAIEDSECFVLFKSYFQDLVAKNPTFAKMVQGLREKRAFQIKQK